MNISPKPGLYVHIPFCQSKCGYCDFYSIVDDSLINPFLNGLLEEIKLTSSCLETSEKFDTIYFGGGTPSLLCIKTISKILNALSTCFHLDNNCEITLEANPGTINLSKLKELSGIGINRMSIGVQSFIDEELQSLQRIHSAKQAVDAIEATRNAGINNIDIDLIFAIPNQSFKKWYYSLNQALAFHPEHISVYNLTYEPETIFYEKLKNGRIIPVSEDEEIEYFNVTHAHLKKSGYLHYEVSNYAKSESFVSRHNYKYWDHTPYLGFGPSAHSFWENRRWANVRSITEYIACLSKQDLPRFGEELIDIDQLIFENIFLALRTYQGLRLADFESRFGFNFIQHYRSPSQKLIDNKLAIIQNDYFKLTEKGMLICDEILPQFSAA
jgi:oxygen-independent coproporphyrinogen-3 oxidase